MIRSMTGYGGARGEADNLEFTIELKSVNNRYLDTNIRMPRSFIFLEEALKARVQNHISRGKVDVFINMSAGAMGDVEISVNQPLAEGYVEALRSLSELYGLHDDISSVDIARFNDVLRIEKREADRGLVSDALCGLIEQALTEFDVMRVTEGARLVQDMELRLSNIEKDLEEIEKRSPETVNEYRQRLTQKIEEVLKDTNIDSSRILTEAAIFADKVSITEETVRIHSHLNQFRELLKTGSPVGRKLDFLVQELNREANTIGSKSNDMEITRHVVDLKSELEKIREQIQNIE